MNFKDTLQQAITHHKAGELKDAEKLYRSILTEEPKHPDTNHNLGILLKQGNQADFALSFFKTALESDPNQDQFCISYLDTLMHLGQLDSARNILKQCQLKGLKGNAVDQIVTRLSSQPQQHRHHQKPLNPNDFCLVQNPMPRKVRHKRHENFILRFLIPFPKTNKLKKASKPYRKVR